MSQKARSTFVLVHPTEILQALVGLKDVRVLRYERRGPHVGLMVEQVPGVVHCPTCHGPAQIKERPVVHYVDLPVYGTPMSLAWRKHRMRCVDPACAKKSCVNGHRELPTGGHRNSPGTDTTIPQGRPGKVPADGHGFSPRTATGTPRGQPGR